jgi:hypothetical protein
MNVEHAFSVPAPDARQRVRRLLHAALGRVGLLDAAKAATAGVLGNRLFRRYCTSGFTSGKLALGERNKYVLPVFPLDWIRVDIEGSDFDLDMEQGCPFPFENASQRLLYTAHLVEHLDQKSFEHFLAECARVLAPGGAIRIETPDAELLIQAYRQRDEAVLHRFRENRRRDLVERLGLPEKYLEDHLTVLGELSNYIDHRARSGHIPVYASKAEFDDKLDTLDLEGLADWCVSLQTPEQLSSGGHQNWMTWQKLRDHLQRVGFSRVERASFGVTTIPRLALNHGRGSIKEKPHRSFYSVYVEAFK